MKSSGIAAILLFVFAGVTFQAARLYTREYPVSAVLVNREGKTLEGLILGKEDGVLTVQRKADRARFDIEIASLAMRSRVTGMMLREQSSSLPGYPITRTLVDSQGKKMAAIIQGKSGGQLSIVRLDDDAQFKVLIDSLSPDDREFWNQLPDGFASALAETKAEVESYLERNNRVLTEVKDVVGLDDTDSKPAEKENGPIDQSRSALESLRRSVDKINERTRPETAQ